MKSVRSLKFALILAMAGALALGAGAQTITLTVDASKTGPAISPLLYGFFTELLSNMYEGGPWAEMLGDRKFFYPVDSKPTQTPPNSRRFVGRWRPVGPDDFVTMDAKQVWVGKHSPVIRLDGATPHGIQQAGLGLLQGKQYSGRVLLAGEPGVTIKASLIWGPNPGDRQTIEIPGVRTSYAKFPLKFTAAGATMDGTLEIVGTGKGSFHIGAVSLMPADNINGFRADIINIWKEVGPTVYRWPGGNFASGYDWRDGIGDPDKRKPVYDYAWNALEPNDVGIEEFMTLTRILPIEPYICVNDGFGDAHSAAEEVEYFNGAATTPMGKLRAANGHPEPYKVKWWNIGNEMYGSWQLGHMSLSHYAIKHNMFAEAMRAADPTIKIVASGATPAEMSSTDAARAIQGKPQAQFGDPNVDWTGGLLAKSSDYLDAIAEHLYPRGNQYFDSEKQAWAPSEDSPIDRARRLSNRVKCAAEAWQEYQRRFPNLKMDSIPIALDEWAVGSPGLLPGMTETAPAPGGGGRGPRASMFTAISAGEALQEMFRYSGNFWMGAYTASTGMLSFDKVAANISPVGLMFKLYRRHFGTIPVAITGSAPQREVNGTVNFDKPKVSSGSDTYPVDVAAAFTPDRKALTIAIINPSDTEQQIGVTLQGLRLGSQGRLWKIAATNWNPLNAPGKPREVDIVESAVNQAPTTLVSPKLSIQIFEFPVQ
jgi:alpha-L-arabinofuranosidase